MPLAKPLRHDDLDRLAEELQAAIAEETLGLRVDEHDLAGVVDDDDRVRRRLQEPAELLLARLEYALCLLAQADVAHGARDDESLLAPQRAEADLDRKLAAVLAHAVKLAAGPHAAD